MMQIQMQYPYVHKLQHIVQLLSLSQSHLWFQPIALELTQNYLTQPHF